jgi:hypothetical protein
MPYGPTNFRSTVIKPYYAEEKQVRLVEEPVNKPVNVQHCNQGRLPGSHNKPQPAATHQSARQNAASIQDIDNQFISAV